MGWFWQFAGKRRFLNRQLRHFQPDVLEIPLSNEESLFVDPKDLYGPSFYVMYGGRSAFYHYEEPVKAAILEHLPLNGLFFDVGANIGLISLFISKFRKDVQIVSFEPAYCTSKALERTIEKNEIKRIHLERLGVSDKSQKNVSFFIDSKSSGGNSLLESAISHDVNTSESISLVSLDDYVKTTQRIPSLVKVDVQDAESLVIRGASELIKRHQPVFVIEVNNELLLKDPIPFVEIFQGYKVYKVGTSKKVDIQDFAQLAQEYLDQNQKVLDYVFVKK